MQTRNLNKQDDPYRANKRPVIGLLTEIHNLWNDKPSIILDSMRSSNYGLLTLYCAYQLISFHIAEKAIKFVSMKALESIVY